MSPFSTVFVESEESLLKAIEELSSHSKVAFDAEGVDLGRNGPLTIATFLGLDIEDSPVYVVDVQTIGGDRVFSAELPSFLELLENEHITKVAFDCRGDSDALFHQFGAKLSGVLDLQVLDQAVRIHLGESPPQRCPYLQNGGIPYIQSMQNVLARNFPASAAKKLASPHCLFDLINGTSWAKRPLSASAVEYAANDVYIIKIIFHHLQKFELSDNLRNGVKSESVRYEGMFRDREKVVERTKEKDFVMEEHSIVAINSLPASHPHKPGRSVGHAQQKWNEVVRQLQAGNGGNGVFQQVIFVLQHDYWYTKEAFVFLRSLASPCPFTPKQRNRIASPPKLKDEYDESDDYGDDYSMY